jgi:hypothetical protein
LAEYNPARPDRAVFKFRSGFIQADTALIAGPVFVIGFVAGGEGDFVRVAAVAVFRHFNRGERSNINTEHIGGIAGLEVQVGVPGGVRKVGFVFIFGDVFTVTLTLPVIDTAREGRIIDETCCFGLWCNTRPDIAVTPAIASASALRLPLNVRIDYPL